MVKKDVYIEAVGVSKDGTLVTLKYVVIDDPNLDPLHFMGHYGRIFVRRENLSEENVLKMIQEKEAKRLKRLAWDKELEQWLGKHFVIEVEE